MSRSLLFLLLLPWSACGQSTAPPSATADLVKIYTLAIGDFIDAANAKNPIVFDTLFIAKRQNGQPDDFPDIALPERIKNTAIKLITPEQADYSQKEKNTRIYINLMGWVEKADAEFIFIVFSNGFEHIYDYTIHYTYNIKKESFELANLQFKGPPFDK